MQRGRGVLIGLLVVLASLVSTAAADEQSASEAPLANLAAQLAAPQSKAGPAREALLAQTRRELDQALLKLDAFLLRAGTPVARSWKGYLDSKTLEDELRTPAPDPDRLAALVRGYYRPQPGLEMAPFLAVRSALHRYALLLETRRDDFEKTHAERLDELNRLLAKYEQDPRREEAWAIGRTIGWLETSRLDSGQAATQIRGRLNYPNAYFYGSGKVANEFLTRKVHEKHWMNESIAGAHTEGEVITQGVLNVATAPQRGHLAIELRLAGQSRCENTVSQRGPATIFSRSVTDLDARVRLFVGADALRVASPVANCTTHTDILDIEARNPVVERIATRRAPKKLPEAEEAAARWAEDHVGGRLHREVSKLVSTANTLYVDKIRKPLIRAGAFPRLNFSSDQVGLQIEMSQADPFQLAAPGPPPPWKANADVAVCVHESMPENVMENLLGSRQITDEQFLGFVEVLLGEAPRALWVHDRSERWSVRLPPLRPAEMTFRDGGVNVALNLAEVVRGKERIPCTAKILATFDVEATIDGPALKRRGDLRVELAVDGKEAAEVEALRTFLRQKFGAMFAEEIFFDGLAPPVGGFGERLRRLQMSQMTFEDGWATISYRLGKPEQNALVSAEK